MTDAVATASPARHLTMLYDRLIVDLSRAEHALAAGDRGDAAPSVGHAQEIVGELIGMLDVQAWDGAERLMSIYSFVLRELFVAGATGNVARVASCRTLLEPLSQAWHEAADEAVRAAARDISVAEPFAADLLGVG
jgi:flagellar protein FliS